MAEDADDKPKEKSFISQLVFPVVVALMVGGTAPWWVSLLPGNESQSANSREATLGENVTQTNSESGFNISADGDVNVTALAESNNIPTFEGEVGHYEMSQPFTDFIFENQGKVVLIDVYYTPADSDEFVIVNNSFGVDYIHLWHECFEPLSPDESPSSYKCIGTSFSLDRSESQKDADFTYVRGSFRAQGYFAIRGCDGPYQGSMGCMLRPLNPEDV
jgi:hypothetical protein